MKPALTFADSGKGESDLTLKDVMLLAIEYNFVKQDSDSSKPLRRRADLRRFFDYYGCNAFSNFKRLFDNQTLGAPTDNSNTFAAEKLDSAHTGISVQPMPVEQYNELASGFEKLKWRLHARPGGAMTRPEDFYRLYGLKMQAEEGDCNHEKPIWDAHGSLDWHGRECWEAWNALKGMSAKDAKEGFCKVYAEALHNHSNNFRA